MEIVLETRCGCTKIIDYCEKPYGIIVALKLTHIHQKLEDRSFEYAGIDDQDRPIYREL